MCGRNNEKRSSSCASLKCAREPRPPAAAFFTYGSRRCRSSQSWLDFVRLAISWSIYCADADFQGKTPPAPGGPPSATGRDRRRERRYRRPARRNAPRADRSRDHQSEGQRGGSRCATRTRRSRSRHSPVRKSFRSSARSGCCTVRIRMQILDCRTSRDFPSRSCGQMCSTLSISYSIEPFGAFTTTVSPSDFPTSARAIGDITDILFCFRSASSSPTIL